MNLIIFSCQQRFLQRWTEFVVIPLEFKKTFSVTSSSKRTSYRNFAIMTSFPVYVTKTHEQLISSSHEFTETKCVSTTLTAGINLSGQRFSHTPKYLMFPVFFCFVPTGSSGIKKSGKK